MKINLYKIVALVAIAACLFSLGFVTSLFAQTRRPSLPETTVSVYPTVVSGGDIGFRLERTVDGIAVGRVVIRVDGRWIDTTAPVTIAR